jgi:polyhydroxyalkanoate synthesis regulator phasin
MADKRATPETPQQPAQDSSRDAQGEPSRNKRAAPTIDLTAKEVPGEGAAAESPEAAAAIPHRSSLARLGIAVGAGAALVVLALFGLWRGGIIPIGTANSPALAAKVAELEKQVSELQSRPAVNADTALAERVDKIEAAVAKLSPADPAISDKLAAADKAMKSLGLALTALSHRTDDASANAADARKAADAAAKAVADLQTSIATNAASSAAGVPQADIEALKQRVAALETQAKSAHETLARNGGNDSAARLALSAQVLRSAVTVGAPYAAELAAVKQLGGDATALAALAPFAANGIPDKKALANELTAAIPQMEKIVGAPPASANFLERLQANAGSLVSIRPVKAPQGDDPSAVLARVEVDAANADVAAALADLARLPEKVRAVAAGWIEKAKARQAAVAAANQYAAATARALSPQ